jgi:fibronectin type 3 domain-containing protein
VRKIILLSMLLLVLIGSALANTPGKHSVSMTWTEAPCPTCSLPSDTFNVYRGTATGVCSGTPTPYATGITTTSFVDNAVTVGTTYFYAVSAVNGGESACSPEAQISVPTSPASPSGLQGVAH